MKNANRKKKYLYSGLCIALVITLLAAVALLAAHFVKKRGNAESSNSAQTPSVSASSSALSEPWENDGIFPLNFPTTEHYCTTVNKIFHFEYDPSAQVVTMNNFKTVGDIAGYNGKIISTDQLLLPSVLPENYALSETVLTARDKLQSTTKYLLSTFESSEKGTPITLKQHLTLYSSSFSYHKNVSEYKFSLVRDGNVVGILRENDQNRTLYFDDGKYFFELSGVDISTEDLIATAKSLNLQPRKADDAPPVNDADVCFEYSSFEHFPVLYSPEYVDTCVFGGNLCYCLSYLDIGGNDFSFYGSNARGGLSKDEEQFPQMAGYASFTYGDEQYLYKDDKTGVSFLYTQKRASEYTGIGYSVGTSVYKTKVGEYDALLLIKSEKEAVVFGQLLWSDGSYDFQVLTYSPKSTPAKLLEFAQSVGKGSAPETPMSAALSVTPSKSTAEGLATANMKITFYDVGDRYLVSYNISTVTASEDVTIHSLVPFMQLNSNDNTEGYRFSSPPADEKCESMSYTASIKKDLFNEETKLLFISFIDFSDSSNLLISEQFFYDKETESVAYLTR